MFSVMVREVADFLVVLMYLWLFLVPFYALYDW